MAKPETVIDSSIHTRLNYSSSRNWHWCVRHWVQLPEPPRGGESGRFWQRFWQATMSCLPRLPSSIALLLNALHFCLQHFIWDIHTTSLTTPAETSEILFPKAVLKQLLRVTARSSQEVLLDGIIVIDELSTSFHLRVCSVHSRRQLMSMPH